MKKNLVRIPVLMMMLFLVLFSCKKDKVDTADADVYIKAILNDGEPVYGLVHYVFGLSAMSSVSVEFPGGTEDMLTAYSAGKTTYYSEPSLGLGTYSTTPPTPGTYTYNVSFESGIQKIFTNELGTVYLLPPTITSLMKTTGSQSVTLIWAPLTGVDSYQLSIIQNGTTLYTSNAFLPPTNNTIEIPLSFIPSYTPGTYTYKLDAAIFEDADPGKLQAISSASASVDL